MRLLAIAGEGLASLSEPFAIDFSAPPLAGAGLFLIAGPTGAGKSTLLDALSLALFDRFPRLDGARVDNELPAPGGDEPELAENPAAILTRGRGVARAEVRFVAIDGRVHVARWEVRRARGRPDARLQQSEVRLARVEADGTEAALGGRKRDTLAEIQRLLGLGFEQFMRTVVLAQGRFDAFLTAPEPDRGELLERIAGEEIFSALSRKVFELARARREAVARAADALDAAAALDDAARAALEQERAALVAGEATHRAVMEALRAGLAWWREEAKLATQASVAEEARDAAMRRRDALGEASAELALRRAALGLAPILREAANAEAASIARARASDEAGKALAEAQAKATLARAEEEKARAALAAAEATRARHEPEWEEATRLDVALVAGRAAARREAEDATCPAPEREAIAARLREGADPAHGKAEAARAAARLGEDARGLEAEIEAGPRPLDAHDAATLRAREQSLGLALGHAAELQRMARSAAEAREAARRAEAQAQEAEARAAGAATEATAVAGELSLARARLDAMAGMLAELDATLGDAAERLRATLADGRPCPVCGSPDHPLHDPGLSALRDRHGAAIEAARAEANALEARATGLREAAASDLATARSRRDSLADARGAEARARESWTRARAALLAHRAAEDALPAPLPEAPGTDAADAAHAALDAARRAVLDALEAQRLLAQRREARAAVAAAQRAWEALAALLDLARARDGLLDGAPTAGHRDGVRRAEEEARRRLDEARARQVAAIGTEAAARASHDKARQEAEAAAEARDAQAGARDEALSRAGIDARRAARFVAEGEAARDSLERRIGEAEDAAKHAEALLREARARLDAHRGAGRPARDAAALGAEVAASEQAHGAALKRVGEIGGRLDDDDRDRARRARLGTGLEEAREAAAAWDAVNDAIGSQNGARFRNFAQRYTFEQLVALANAQLASILPRYRLRAAAATGLSLHVLDRHMGDEARAPRSLSGGERFLLALALALGLSRLGAGRSVVETLFIDEGFGSLDPQSLDRAMQGLEALQGEGRAVGVITHVEAMKERIATQVLVEPQGGGRSRLRIVAG